MIAELFYPRELKNIIADLRENQNLNENALRFLNRHIYIHVLAWLFLLAFTLTLNWLLIVSVVLLSLFLIKYDAYDTYKRYLLPYLKKASRKGVVTNVTYNRFGGIQLQVHLGKETYNTEFLLDWKKIPRPSKGEELSIYINPKKPYSAMPDHPLIKDHYSLCLKY